MSDRIAAVGMIVMLVLGCQNHGKGRGPAAPGTGGGGAAGAAPAPGGGGGSGGGAGAAGGSGGASGGQGGAAIDAAVPGAGGAGGVDAAGADGPARLDGPPAADGKAMRIYWIDAEGGAATLVVAPNGETILADAGWAGGRDTRRIVAVLEQELGRKRIDYLVATHFHGDHVGGVAELARAVPVGTFVDHGASVEGGDGGYRAAIGQSRRMSVMPGEKLMLGELEVTFVSSHGRVVEPLPTATANPACAGAQTKNDQPDEDPRSVGFLARYGKFEFVDLGDLTWGVESQLACPMNRLGVVDLFQSSQHGSAESNARQLVHGLAPTVVVINCGAAKGGSAMSFETFKTSPGIQDIWQVHRVNNLGAGSNTDEALIANAAGPDMGHWIRATIEADGSYVVTNGRTMQSRRYQSK